MCQQSQAGLQSCECLEWSLLLESLDGVLLLDEVGVGQLPHQLGSSLSSRNQKLSLLVRLEGSSVLHGQLRDVLHCEEYECVAELACKHAQH